MIQFRTKFAADSLLEEAGLELFVPLWDQRLSELVEPCAETTWRAGGEFLRDGTVSSNPSPSRGEAANHQFLGGGAMFPIANGVPLRCAPVTTWALIAANCVVFLFEVSLSPSELDGS